MSYRWFSPKLEPLPAAVLGPHHVDWVPGLSQVCCSCSCPVWWAWLDVDQGGRATVNLCHFCPIKFAKGVSLTVIKLEACSCLLIPFIYGLQPLIAVSYDQSNNRFTAETTASCFDRNWDLLPRTHKLKDITLHPPKYQKEALQKQLTSGLSFNYILRCISD